MKKNIGLLTVLATLTLGSTVFANSPQKPEVTISVEDESKIDEVSYENSNTLVMALPEEYSNVSVMPKNGELLIFDIMVGEDLIGKVEVMEDSESVIFTASEEEFQNSEIIEILKYIEENENDIFKYTSDSYETTDVMDLTTVYNGQGYIISMPVDFQDEVQVISTRSMPPQLIFNYVGDEETKPIFRLEIIRGEYTGDNEVIKSGNGYTFAIEFVESEESTERFTEIQDYFKDNTESLVTLALDYTGGDKAIILNGEQVGEYIGTGEGEYMIPLRTVSESLEMDVIWNNETKVIEVTNGKLLIQLKIGEEQYSVNRAFKKFERAPIAIDGTTYVPLSFIKDGLGLQYQLGNGALVIS